MANGSPFEDFTEAELREFVQAATACFKGKEREQALLYALLGLAASQINHSRDGHAPDWTVKFSYNKQEPCVEVHADPQTTEQAVWEQRFMESFLPGSQETEQPVAPMRVIP